MSKPARSAGAAAGTIILLLFPASSAFTKQATNRTQQPDTNGSAYAATGRAAYLKAFVINDRLSALRREPGLQSQVIRRLRLGHPVFILSSSKPKTGQPRFCRVAVTRRTRGWVHESALGLPSRRGEDQRIVNLIEGSSDGFDRITLCRMIIERFSHSPFVPRAMLLLGEEADRVAETLSQRTRKRLAEVRGTDASLRDYYLSDAGLDRYSRLGIAFDFNEPTAEFVYDGRAYREILRRFPEGDEARFARQRLDIINQKTALQR